ncbi:MAG: saccharopine dehydrogenase NADP-binding domain-containing protein, partial [Parabacteroides sp.]|nr:saccharopine dehydrogenase NADP-binding domain-containing protein [Parabacteroides sp.]
MKVLVVGAGGQGAPCASVLARDNNIKEIRLADIDLNICKKVASKIGSPKIKPIQADASDVDEIADAAKGADVIIDLVTPIFFVNIMKAALRVNAHYVNTAWEEYLYEGYEEHDVMLGAKLKMHDDFAEKGLTAILGCGMTSGFASNVLVRYYSDKLDTVESVRLRLAKKDISIS